MIYNLIFRLRLILLACSVCHMFVIHFVAFVSLVGLVYSSATLVSPRVRQLATYSHKYMNGFISRNAFETIIRDQGSDTRLQSKSRNSFPRNLFPRKSLPRKLFL